MMRAIAALSLLSVIGIGADPVGVCPSTNGAYVDFLIDDKDCNKFYKCDWGKPILYICPSDLHFNSKLNVCDWPANAECSGSVGPTSPTTTTTDKAPTPHTTQPPLSNSGDCALVSCPYTPGVYPVFHAHPKNCGRYCKCDNYGTVHDMPCPDGLHFNTELNVCDWPVNAGCAGSSTPTTTTTTTEKTTPLPTTTPAPPPPITPTPAPNPGDCTAVSCPYTPALYPVFHAHPKNCGRYCKCDNYGTVHDMPCPDGLHFNTELNVCDWPANAGCDRSSTPTTTTTTTEKTTLLPTTTPAPSPPTTPAPAPNPGDCTSVSCPYTPALYPVFHAHPKNCGRYCKCDNYGTVHDMPCPDGLHFNTELNVCDWPANAGCDGSSTPTTTTTTTEKTTSLSTTTPAPAPPTTPAPAPNPGDCTSVSCPYTPALYPVFHAHPKDCGRYCKCDNYGTVHDMPCPDGLHFNTALNVCDWPLNDGCDGSSSTPTTSDTTTDAVIPDVTTTTTTHTPPTTPVSGDDCSSVVCPSQNGEFPVFHSHPKVCDRYCKCDWGVAFDMPCPTGLHFNPVLNVCDNPADANCPHNIQIPVINLN